MFINIPNIRTKRYFILTKHITDGLLPTPYSKIPCSFLQKFLLTLQYWEQHLVVSSLMETDIVATSSERLDWDEMIHRDDDPKLSAIAHLTKKLWKNIWQNKKTRHINLIYCLVSWHCEKCIWLHKIYSITLLALGTIRTISEKFNTKYSRNQSYEPIPSNTLGPSNRRPGSVCT